jgi:hypothetical protein
MSEQGHWEASTARWFELRLLYCGLCGKVIPGRFWQVDFDGTRRIFCDPACEALYRSYVVGSAATPVAPPG